MLLKRAYTRSDFERMVSETRFDGSEMRAANIGLEILLSKSPRCLDS
jgi:hypothetical protein